MIKDKYHEWVVENDSYPEHSHTWIAKFYHRLPGSQKEVLYRQFGPFPDKDKAMEFANSYLTQFTKSNFVTRWQVDPLCTP